MLASGFLQGSSRVNAGGRRFVMLIPVQSAKLLSVLFPHDMPILTATCAVLRTDFAQIQFQPLFDSSKDTER